MAPYSLEQRRGFPHNNVAHAEAGRGARGYVSFITEAAPANGIDVGMRWRFGRGGLVSALMAFMRTAWQFYVLRFLLGAAEASLYPVIYASCIPRFFAARDRARAIAVLLTSLQVSAVIGAPLAGWLTGVRLFGFAGWQVLFLVEAVPALALGAVVPFWLADGPREAR